MTETSSKVVEILRGLPPEKLKLTLDRRDLARKYLDDVEVFALQANAETLREIGYVLVKKYGRRRWAKPPDEVKAALVEAGADADEIEESILVSPAKAEKIVGRSVVNALSETPETGYKLSRIEPNQTSYEDLFGE